MSKWDELKGEAGTPALDSRHDTPWPINRREVVAGATALLVLNSLPGRAAQLQPVKADCSALFESLGFYTDLAFEWDSENKTLAVHENLESSKAQQDLVADCIAELQGIVNDKERKSEHKKARADLKNLWEALRPDNARFRTWQTELSPLDPTPDIQLTSIKKPGFGYRLTILCAGRRIHETAVAPSPAQLRSIVLTFTRAERNRWTVAIGTDFWSLKAERINLGQASFADVAGDSSAGLEEGVRVPAAAAEYAFGQLFGHQFRLSGPLRVGMDARLRWTFPAPGKTDGSLLLHGTRAVCQKLCKIDWQRRQAPATGSANTDAAPEMLIVAEGKALVAGSIVLGDNSAFHVHFVPQSRRSQPGEADSAGCLAEQKDVDLITFKVSNSSRMTGSETELKAWAWTFDVQNGKAGLTSKAGAKGLLVRREVPGAGKVIAFEHEAKLTDIGPTPAALDDLAAAQAAAKAPPAAVEDRVVFPFLTPAGVLKVSGQTSKSKSTSTVSEVSKDGKPPETSGQQAAADGGTSETKTEEEAKPDKDPPPELLVRSLERYDGKVSARPVEILQQAHLKLSLVEAPFALADASYSRLRFDNTSLSLIYAVGAVPDLPASYIWLDPPRAPDGLLARFNLTRAELAAQNDVELLSLKFRFADLALLLPLVNSGNTKDVVFARAAARIVPLPDDCRIAATAAKGVFLDNRPRLVVEFPPQHVLEEVLFRPQPESPPAIVPADINPDLAGKTFTGPNGLAERQFSYDPRLLVLELTGLSRAQRARVRTAWFDETSKRLKEFKEQEAIKSKDKVVTEDSRWTEFKTFRTDFILSAGGLAEDQRAYIGPTGLAPDAFALARAVARKRRDKNHDAEMTKLAAGLAATRQQAILKEPALGQTENRLKLEAILESEHPVYALFRSAYSDAFYRSAADSSLPKPKPDWQMDESGEPAADFIFMRPGSAGIQAYLKADYFLRALSGEDPVPDTVRARLANPSRLVFAVNCDSGVHEAEELSTGARGPIAFSLAGLTDWSRHELVVVRRAQQLFEADPHGLLGPLNKRVASITNSDILQFQGITPNAFTTVQQRLSDVAAALRQPPGAYETAIEIPARLVLSPNQSAAWTTPHPYDSLMELWPPPANQIEQQLFIPAPSALDQPQRPRGGSRPLWMASIDSEVAEPGLRAVYSPDFRPGFFWSKFPVLWRSPPPDPSEANIRIAALLKVLGNRPPPRGPLAPWHLGREQSEDEPPAPEDLFKVLPPTSGDWPVVGEEICKTVEGDPNTYRAPDRSFSIPRLIAYLCGRKSKRENYADAALFRAALDAYDRHELVLLTSAYGLPVQGKRDASDALIRDADQFEPPEGYELADLYGDTAIYRPRTLNLRELTLTSMGGSFRHDTAFQPPAAALHMGGERVFDSLSIERWQQWTVLGRDIVVEVVYKGYLFPLGVRASLVKLTERTFLKGDRGFIKAYLRQRMFIRCGKPEKLFPAMRQPNGGRRFPAELLRMLTVTTPDIVDPTSTAGAPKKYDSVDEWSSGRLKAVRIANTGLMFWPRTSLSESSTVSFEVTIDGRKTRLPLIFIDNAATQEQAQIDALVRYYNDLPNPDYGSSTAAAKCPEDSPLEVISPQRHKRTLVFGGQAMRYCEERKVGDSSIETDSWTLIAEGRRRAGGDGASVTGGLNTDYLMDAQMQGADQPPFYPALATARIRIKQVERLSGRTAPPTLVQFDGGYIEDGFDDKAVTERNTLEVYLNFARPVELDMGNNGDRAGGMYSPGNDFVAMSRKNGPVGGKDGGNVLCIGTPGGLEKWSAKHLSYGAATGSAQETTGANVQKSDRDINKIKVLQNYFSGKAKLFGIIRIDKLIEFLGLDLEKPNELPVIGELIEYGASAMHQAEAAGSDIKAFLKTEVLVPLLEIITGLETRWQEVQQEWQKAREKAGDTTGYLDLAQLFPEVGTGLKALREAIGTARKTEDTIAFAIALSAVYEAGQQLVAGLRRIAADPAGRVTEGAKKLFDAFSDAVRGELARLTAFLRLIEGQKQALVKLLLDRAAEAISEDLLVVPDEFPLIKNGFSRLNKGYSNYKVAFEALVSEQTRDEFNEAINDFADSAQKALRPDRQQDFIRKALYWLVGEKGDPFGVFDLKGFKEKWRRIEEAAKAVIDEINQNAPPELAAAWLDAAVEQLGADDLAKVLWTLSAAQEFAARARALEEDATAIVTGLSGIDSANPEALDKMASCLRLLQPHLPNKQAGQVERLVSFTERVAAIWRAVDARDFEPAVRETLALLAPAIGSYTVEDLKRAAAPLDEAYKAYLRYLVKAVRPLAETGVNAVFGARLNDLSMQLQGLAAFIAANRQAVDNLPDTVLPEQIQAFKSSFERLETSLEPAIRSWVPVQALLRHEAAAAAGFAKTIPDEGNLPHIWDLLENPAVSPNLTTLRELLRLRLAIANEITKAADKTFRPMLDFLQENLALLSAVAALAGAARLVPNLDQSLKDFIFATETLLTKTEAELGQKLKLLTLAAIDLGLSVTGIAQQSVSGLDKVLETVHTALTAAPAGLGEQIRIEAPLKIDQKGLDGFHVELVKYRGRIDSFSGFQGTDSQLRPLERLKAFMAIVVPDQLLIKAAKDLGKFTEQHLPTEKLRRLVAALPIEAERRLQAMVDRLQAEATVFAEQRVTALVSAAAKVIAEAAVLPGGFNWPGLLEPYRVIQKVRTEDFNKALKDLPEALKAPIRKALVVPKPGQQPGDATTENDLLVAEIEFLERAKYTLIGDAKGIADLRAYIGSWRAGTAAPLQLAKNIEELVGLVLRGDFASLIDFSAIRDEVERRIKQLVPLRATLGYTFGGPFTDKKKVADVTAGIFAPEDNTRLDIRTSVKVEFLKPDKPQVNVVGDLGPFSIKLVGDMLDAVTINFHGARFTIKDGKSPDVDLFYKDFKIGKALEFVQRLQAFLTPEKGSGFYLKFSTRPLGIEAGYGLSMPMIPLGPVIFSNISLNAGMLIPFDGGETRFRASLSRVDAPFTISVVPYGGSGYFGIEANADGVVGFDAAFEFGGAAAFQFGPLKGIGRLMLGVYIRQTRVTLPPDSAGNARSKTLVEIMGTFYVGGSASIWIFNFGASLYVRLGMSGGNMVGDATFTFSFSCGFVDFDYSISVRRQENKMGQGAFLDMGRKRYAQLMNGQSDVTGTDQTDPTRHFRLVKRENATVCQGASWSGYKRYFDYSIGSKPDEEDFL